MRQLLVLEKKNQYLHRRGNKNKNGLVVLPFNNNLVFCCCCCGMILFLVGWQFQTTSTILSSIITTTTTTTTNNPSAISSSHLQSLTNEKSIVPIKTTVRTKSTTQQQQQRQQQQCTHIVTTNPEMETIALTRLLSRLMTTNKNSTTTSTSSTLSKSSTPRTTTTKQQRMWSMAVQDYEQMIIKAIQNRIISHEQQGSSYCQTGRTICMDHVFHCLELTNNQTTSTTSSSTRIQYPINDAESHFYEIHYNMSFWSQHYDHKIHTASGYNGPWIENIWITNFFHQQQWMNTSNNTNNNKTNDRNCFVDIFGSFIPIFIPFVDLWVNNGYRYETKFVTDLRSILRPNVPYITISQNADGIHGNHVDMIQLLNIEFPNILIVSAGGYGHIPIPLVKQKEHIRNQLIPISQRTNFISYVGSLTNAPHQMRQRIHKKLLRWDKQWKTKTNNYNSINENHITTWSEMDMDGSTTNTTTTTTTSPPPSPVFEEIHRHIPRGGSSSGSTTTTIKNFYMYYYGENWRNIMANSRFSLVPRGYGRTSYHLMETLQMGFIPIVVYTDIPWIPYQDLLLGSDNNDDDSDTLNNLVLTVHARNMTQFMIQELLVLGMNDTELQKREVRIASLVKSHFSFSGIMTQIKAYMIGGEVSSDLRCRALPSSARGIF